MTFQYDQKVYRIPCIYLHQTHKSVSYDELVVKQFKSLTNRDINEGIERFGITPSYRESITIVTNDKLAVIKYYEFLKESKSYRPVFGLEEKHRTIYFELFHTSGKTLMQKIMFVRNYFCDIVGHHQGEDLISLDHRIVMRKTCFFPVRVRVNEKKWCLGYIKLPPSERKKYLFPFSRFIVDVNKYKEFELYDF